MLASDAASAQTVADTERQLLAERAGVLSGIDQRFWAALSDLRKEEDKQRSLKADITFGLTGDEAGSKSLFKLNTGITLSRGVYPSEITVISRLGLQQKDGKLQEDVTTLQISYDYHATRSLQYFAFAERFSDSFLSIQQRYEVGFGLRVGRHFGHVPAWSKTAAMLSDFREGLPAVVSATAAMPALARRSLTDMTDPNAGLRRAVDRIEQAVHDRSARFFVGFVASAFAELERAEIEVTSLPSVAGEAPVTSRVAIDATHRYRLSLRPSFIVRPSNEIEIVVYPYFKLPIDGERRVVTADGRRRLDYRRDVISRMEWTIKEEQTGLESVGFVVDVNHFYDHVPPALPAPFVAAAAATGRLLDRLEADRRHRTVALSLKLKW